MTSDLITDKDGETWTRYQAGEYLAQWREDLKRQGWNNRFIDDLTINRDW